MPERDPETDEPPLEVAALGYDRGVDAAPRVLAKGRGELAQRILETAAEHSIPVTRDRDLLSCLGALQVGDDIPIEAYQAVAHILAFLYRQNGPGDEASAEIDPADVEPGCAGSPVSRPSLDCLPRQIGPGQVPALGPSSE